MKKIAVLTLACVIGIFSISFSGCGPGKAKDAKSNPDAAEKMNKESKDKTEKGGG